MKELNEKTERKELFKLIAWHKKELAKTNDFAERDLVVSTAHGLGVVTTTTYSENHPIAVEFNDRDSFSYTKDGRYGGRETNDRYAIALQTPKNQENTSWHKAEIERIRALKILAPITYKRRAY